MVKSDDERYEAATEVLMSYLWAAEDYDGLIDGTEKLNGKTYIDQRKVQDDIGKLQEKALEEEIIDEKAVTTEGGAVNPNALPKFYGKMRDEGLINIRNTENGLATSYQIGINSDDGEQPALGSEMEYHHIGEIADPELKEIATEYLEDEMPRSSGWRELERLG